MQMYSEADVDRSCLEGRQITILGYGSQGRAHALNLKDSGHNVVIGARADGGSFAKAEADGFVVMEPVEAVKGAAIVAILTPDTSQSALYSSVEANIDQGAALLFAHGFNIHYGQIVPPASVNVCMVAPKGPGHMVRAEYEAGSGVPSLIAVHQDASGDTKDVAMAYASAVEDPPFPAVGNLEPWAVDDRFNTDGQPVLACDNQRSVTMADEKVTTAGGAEAAHGVLPVQDITPPPGVVGIGMDKTHVTKIDPVGKCGQEFFVLIAELIHGPQNSLFGCIGHPVGRGIPQYGGIVIAAD
ncbi:MAG: NAD(P)-binding domain-containing protein [Pseudomonadota bacterium]